jgi:hypothetical protein
MPPPPPSLDINRPLDQLLLTHPIPNTLLHILRHLDKIGILLVHPKPHKPPSPTDPHMFIPPTLHNGVFQRDWFTARCVLDFWPVLGGKVHVAPWAVFAFAGPDAEIPFYAFGNGIVGGFGCYFVGVEGASIG